MPRFLTIGYGDQKGYESTDSAVRDRAHSHDEWLISHGAVVGIAGSPIQVRNPDGRAISRKAGAYLRADLPVAGFALVEAANLDEAVELAAKTPCAVAHGVVEVWPIDRR